MIKTIGFDADDTLWHNETLFVATHEKLCELLGRYHDRVQVDDALNATERRNLARYGYGIKSFTLSAIETAIDLSGGQASATEIREIISLAHDMLDHPVEILDGVPETVAQIAASQRFNLIVITKGDLRDQSRKFSLSQLDPHFTDLEVVTEKDPATYERLLRRHGIARDEFLMVGNSIKSDILPVLDIGAHAAHVPYPHTWVLDRADRDPEGERFHALDAITDLPALLDRLTR
ncbi:HAD family hydrolase [Synoicihabitans lomoniglobus]|uniref:HAD hydrolase-like protein n=1 Tax=Synoicihabitans lomoniglobus TaxID=2909285 RepID=A0AAF0CMU3_9BACT|nr:HAD hydrolase-like protein [Opitutaceae bacterium LMO-M01]WED63786.1 HAD hydrolase-like protein [Opitutaceae bacterium LMO-M01]